MGSQLQDQNRITEDEQILNQSEGDLAAMDEREGKEEQVMSEVHLGCPLNSSGPHISHFTISIPPDVDHGRCKGLFKDEEVRMHQMISVDEDGDLVLTRRTSNYSFYD